MEYPDFDQQLQALANDENLLHQVRREERARQPYTIESLAQDKDSFMGDFFDQLAALHLTADTLYEEELFQDLTEDEHEAMRGQLHARMQEAVEQYDALRRGEVIVTGEVFMCIEVIKKDEETQRDIPLLVDMRLEDEQYVQGDIDIYVVEQQPDLSGASDPESDDDETRTLPGLWVKLNNVSVHDPAALESLYESRTAMVLLSFPGVEMYQVLRSPERGPSEDDSFQPALYHLINERHLQECLSIENRLKYFLGDPDDLENERARLESELRSGLREKVENELFLISTSEAYIGTCEAPCELEDEALLYKDTAILTRYGDYRVMHVFALLKDDGSFDENLVYISPEEIESSEKPSEK